MQKKSAMYKGNTAEIKFTANCQYRDAIYKGSIAEIMCEVKCQNRGATYKASTAEITQGKLNCQCEMLYSKVVLLK